MHLSNLIFFWKLLETSVSVTKKIAFYFQVRYNNIINPRQNKRGTYDQNARYR